MKNKKILFSLPTQHHVEIALDELTGMRELGYQCEAFPYAARGKEPQLFSKALVLVQNAFMLVRLAYRHRPDVIYFNSRLEKLAGFRDSLTVAVLRIFYWRKVKLIIKSHGSDLSVIEHGGQIMRKIILPFLRRQVSAWLFLSKEEQIWLSANGFFESSRLHVTKNIVRINQFIKSKDFKSRFGIQPENIVLLFVGRMIPEKGILDVVKAFVKLHQQFPVTLLLVGDGPAYDEAFQLVQAAGAEVDVRLTGFIKEQEVIEFYANSDILLFPTYFPEGFPMALFNSVAAGLAVVTTPVRAAKDYLSEPENCIWVKPQDPNDIEFAVRKLLLDPSLMDQMRQSNLQKSGLFSQQQVANDLHHIIKNL